MTGAVDVSSVADDGFIFCVLSAVVGRRRHCAGIGRISPTNMTTALPPHVVEDRRGRAVLMRGGTVGDGRGGSGWSRVAVDGRAGRLPRLLGRAPVGLGTATWRARDR